MAGELSEEELMTLVRNHPDFELIPLPKSWYAKYNIPVPETPTLRQVLEKGYVFKAMNAYNELPPIILETKEHIPLLPFEDVKVEVQSTVQSVQETQETVQPVLADATSHPLALDVLSDVHDDGPPVSCR